MSEVKQLPTRDEVAESQTWDLSKIFANDEAWEQALKGVQAELPEVAEYAGTLAESATQLLAATQAILDVTRKVEKIYVYASMKSDQDTANSKYQGYNAQAGMLWAKASGAIAYFEPEVLAIAPAVLSEFIGTNNELNAYQHFFDKITEARGHVLTPNEEKLLAGASDIFSASENTFGVLDNADLKFGIVQDEDGNDVQLSNGVYSRHLESTNREVRKQAFTTLYESYDQFQHTFASTLSQHVHGHNYLASVHNYDSARQSALAGNSIPESVFETLIDQVNEHLPLLHRYVALRKRILGVDELHTYDLYTPITGEASLTYDYQSAVATALDALKPLGDDYLDVVQEAFDNRWIDVVENKGKRSGAYSGGAYDTDPYILLNWQDNLDNLFTLVHEMGHSVHSYFTRKNQPYQYGDYSIFLAEIASTTNENILTEYLLERETDPKVRAYILNHYLDGFKGTVFRQTQFAEFEHWLHEEDQAGEPLTAEILSDFYGDLNRRYYGPDLAFDDQIALEWARIPHFYYNYYVYQYATGMSAATTLADNITSGDAQAVAAYKNYLKAGNSDFPIEVMKKAGVDMTQPAYLEQAFKVFEERLNELEALLG
ncbi:oligoendopeptidase F [Periweissella fabaria]|uniref:Oligopeptidase F n=1 Tax=Periweissella fabaria TaxID=546157 RepID=A0ABN8BKA4_9LACO|nr:oligoendopeptidase F [Periweissella fabaria]MCM0597141.1 oligoendopeptidase F [Periweissella fabaria]CAH0417074.1 Oligoendopeptidase F, plasmid [Periweissella fabaria]